MVDFLQLGFIERLESIRHPVLDFFFLCVTRLGEEFLFMGVALAFFWCGKKTVGYFLLTSGFLGTVISECLKLAFGVARPWVADPSFTPVQAAKASAPGFSFPSGHTQVATTLYGGIFYIARRNLTRILALSVILLVAFSRLYLGVHTLADVLMSLAIGVLLVTVLGMVFERVERTPRLMYPIAFFMILAALLNLVYAYVAGSDFVLSSELECLRAAREHAWSLFGAVLALPLILFLDERCPWSGRARPALQVLKVILGLLLALGIKEGMKPLLALFSDAAFLDGIRYFTVVIFAGFLYPYAFERIAARLRRTDERA